MSERAPKCKHPHLHYTRRCKICGEVVDIKEKRNKYGNRRTDGFASAKEARRFEELLSLGVTSVGRQIGYELNVNGVHICDYIADFVYEIPYSAGRIMVEDVKPSGKGFKKTDAYRLFTIKKRLMKACHNIDVVEV